MSSVPIEAIRARISTFLCLPKSWADTHVSPDRVNLDGQIFGPLGTGPVVVEQFQIDLFNQSNMLAGPHTLTISNLPATVSNSPNMNLDYVRSKFAFR
jgi:hypothetical protein